MGELEIGVRDVVGQLVKVGDVVTYPVRFSSSMWVNVGVVRGIEMVSDSRHNEAPRLIIGLFDEKGGERTSRITNIDRITKVPLAPDEAKLAVLR